MESSGTILFKDPKVRRLLAVALGVLALEAGSYFWPGFPPEPVAWAVLLGAAVGGREVLGGALGDLRALKLGSIRLLISLAAVGAALIGEPLEGAVVLSLFTVSEALEEHGFSQSYAALEALLHRAPKQAEVPGRGLVAVDAIVPGDQVRVPQGGILAVDGVVLEGQALVDEASITGEPLPVTRSAGEAVYAGSLLVQGALLVEARRGGKDSTLQRIVQATYQAAERKAAFQSLVERIAKVYTPLVILAALALAAWGLAQGDAPKAWVVRAISLMVVACPCALTMATPVAVFAALSAASRQGAVLKGGRALDALAVMKTLGVDKTRTLTEGKPVLRSVRAFAGWDEDQVLAAAAGLETLTSHPVAKAVVEGSARRGLSPHGMAAVQELAGRGIQGECKVCRDSHHCLGKPDFAEAEHGQRPEVFAEVERLQALGQTAIVLSDGSGAVGVLGVEDALRLQAPALVAQLDALGVGTVMLTGDHARAAQAVAAATGVKEFHAGLLPQDKARILAELGPGTGMLGDGINDAPALAGAAPGIAMGAAGSDLALEHADVALMGDRLEALPYLVRLGRSARSVIRFNVAVSLGLKGAVLALGLAGRLPLDLAILSDVGLTVLVIWNGLRLTAFR